MARTVSVLSPEVESTKGSSDGAVHDHQMETGCRPPLAWADSFVSIVAPNTEPNKEVTGETIVDLKEKKSLTGAGVNEWESLKFPCAPTESMAIWYVTPPPTLKR